jgi:RNA polymerase sigma-70 factor (ECF subfamily)
MDHQFEYDEEADPLAIVPSGAALPPQPVLETVAKLRALSVLLCLDVECAEELVAVTLIRAGAGFDPSRFDPNLTAWLYRRLRSYYYRDYAAQRETSAAPALRNIDHSAAFAALAELPVEQREAIVLVEAAGFSLREATAICRCTRNRFRELLRRARAGVARALPPEKSGTSKTATVVALFASAQIMA